MKTAISKKLEEGKLNQKIENSSIIAGCEKNKINQRLEKKRKKTSKLIEETQF